MSKKIIFPIIAVVLLCVFPISSYATTLLSDNFSGTTINSTNWTIIDSAGTNITQNNGLTVNGSYAGAVWGATAAVTKQTFLRTNLVVSAQMSGTTSQLLGYGDYNFQLGSAYIIDISGLGGSIYALSWVNGSMPDSNFGCGTAAANETYSIDPTSTGFDVYGNTGSGNQKLCSVTTNTSLSNKFVFLESQTSGVYNNFLVTGTSSATVPAAISDLSATAGVSSASLSWTAPSNGGSAITDYAVDYRVTGNTSWTPFTHDAFTTNSVTVTSLTNSTSYDFRVRAINSVGTALDSNFPSATPLPATAPDTPTSLFASAGDQQATISFTIPSANRSPITSYTVTSSPGNHSASGATLPITVTGLTDGVSYTFTATATNGIGTSAISSPSNSVIPVTGIPLTISGLSLWLDGSDLSTISATSGAITQVNDKSGNSKNATATGSLSPTLVSNVQNGNSLMRFNGSNYLTISSSIAYRTIFVVGKFNATTFNDYNGIIGDVTGVSPGGGHILNGLPLTTNFGSGGAGFSSTYRNGTSVSSDFSPLNTYWIDSFETPSTLTNSTSTIGVLAGSMTRSWNGDIGEIIVYNKTLSSTERTSIEAYLSAKWGIQVTSLPGAISNLSATAGSGQVSLSWSAPTGRYPKIQTPFLRV